MQPFLRTLSLTLALGAVSATTACHRHGDYRDKHDHHGASLSDADAAKITDATVATWQSMDASKIDGLYAPDVVGFDVSAAPLSTDRANWTKLQQGFAAMKFDHLAITQSKTQILDPDTFIFSSFGNLTSTAGTVKALPIRCTDVYRKQADDKFLIVNEHCSSVPGAKA
jgi:ketosteroid isomerase-like protein